MAWYNSGSWGGLKAEGDIKNILSQLCIAVNEREAASFTGWKTISTMTRSGSTVTVVTSAAHGYTTDDWVKIRGCDQTEYNGDWKITVSDTTTFTFTITGTPTTPTTGTRQVGKPYTLFVYDNDFTTKPKPTASDFSGLWLHSCTVNEKTLTSVTCGNSNVLVTHTAHGLLVSDYIRVEDIAETGYDGRRQVTAKTADTFTYGVPGNPDQVTAVGKYAKELAVSSITRSGSTATATSAGHGFSNGDSVFIDGVTETEYNGTFTIFNVTTDTFDYTVSGTPATPASGALKKCGKWVIPEAVEGQQDAVATATLADHRMETDWRVVISGANQTEYNGHFQITKTGSSTFTYPLPL
ncbi:MAG: hypothetical protein IT364_24480, partial [Candidatus Hydrogenedentes bacterium]|nr:hypothetical protein [Candidatus Hydrogenedentota bacterium]